MKEEKTVSAKSIFFWNMLGSLFNAASTVVLTMVVTRLTNTNVQENVETEAGIFSMALGLAQLLMTIGAFEVRPYQSTDIREKYRFTDYFFYRAVTCTLMIIVSAGYILVQGYHPEKALVVLLMCLFKMTDAFSDVFQGLFQQKERLDLSGKSLALRVFLTTVVFTVTLAITHQLILSMVLMLISSSLWILGYDLLKTKKFATIEASFRFRAMKGIFLDCLPLFAGSFMLNYIINGAKLYLDVYCTELQQFWMVIIMPASVINLFSIFIFRPMLTTLATSWNLKEWKRFSGMVRKIMLLLILTTAVVLAGGYLLGIPVLSWLYHLELTPYRTQLMLVLLGGAMSAFSTVFFYLITVMRKQYFLLVGYAVPFLLSFVLYPVLIQTWDMMGAALAYFALMTIQFLAFFGLFYINFWKERKKPSENKALAQEGKKEHR